MKMSAIKNLPKFLEFFAGSGLVTEAMKGLFSPIWANDICEKKAAVYCANHSRDHFVPGSIEDVRGADLPAADLAWASFPCQDLSLAGPQDGIVSGKRSGLVWQWLRVLDEMPNPPKILVAENVLGLVSASAGAHYRALHDALRERGYKSGAVLLDAVHWLPQSRPRIFVVSVPRKTEISLLDAGGPIWAHSKAIQRAGSGLKDWIWWNLPKPAARARKLEEILESDVPVHDEKTARHNLSLIASAHQTRLLQEMTNGFRVAPGYKRTRQGHQVLELRFDGISGCLRTPNGGSSRQVFVINKGGKLATRLPSVRETARLMGAPDHYKIPGSYNDGYWAMGDAVAVPVVRFLAKHLLSPLAKAIHG